MSAHRPSWWLGFVLCLAAAGRVDAAPGSAAAPSVWQRGLRGRGAELELRAALNRATAGHEDERDWARIRAALVEFGRERGPRDPGNVVLLSRLRLELGLMNSAAPLLGPSIVPALRAAAEASPPSELAAMAWFDLARLARLAGTSDEQESYLERALDLVIDAEARARIHLLRGVLLLESSRYEAAARDFSAAYDSTARASHGGLSLLGLGLAEALRGSFAQADLSATAAARLIARAANESGVPLTRGLMLRAGDEPYFLALLARGQWSSVAPDELDLALRACHAARGLSALPRGPLSALDDWLLDVCAADQSSAAALTASE